MKDPGHKLIYLLWAVVATLVIGGSTIGFMLAHKTDQLKQSNTDLTGDNNSLHEQLRQARAALNASPTPSPTPLGVASSYSSTPSPTPIPLATVTPKASNKTQP